MTKSEAFMDLHGTGLVRVHLDARRTGVVLPSRFLRAKHLTLEYGHNLPTPVEGLEVDGFGIRAILSFERDRSVTFIPWSAVFAVTDQGDVGTFWNADVPEGVRVTETVPPEELN